MVQKATIKAVDFLEFIGDLVKDLHRDGENLNNVILLMDNARPHRTKEIFETMKKEKVRCMMTQTYSPELNPAEKIILAIKKKMQLEQFTKR